MNDNKALTVYKASAGSGKTFTLALEFIKLLIDDTHRYDKILAVTFTNKATEEMKHRIVSKLYGLANNLPSSNDYVGRIKDDLGLEERVIRDRAKEALHNLLHNYNYFRVQTIDAFFQSVLRNMAKEIGLGNNMRIALNDNQIISEAVDNLFDDLDHNHDLMNWIMSYINEVMEENKSWHIKDGIKQFGNNLSKEFYKSNEGLLKGIDADKNFFSKYKETLKQLEKGLSGKYDTIYDTFIQALDSMGFAPGDLKQGAKGVAGYFAKLKDGNLDDKIVNSYVRKAMSDENEWGTKDKQKPLAELASSTLIALLNNTEKERQKDSRMLNSVRLTLANINKMRLLTSIREEVDSLNKENSRFMLSNTQTLLKNMIQGGQNDAPFIFEKIGAHLQHIMIDEFQDTSRVQWENFRVLLDECIGKAEDYTEGKEEKINNLIVGDVKQSIYRFRSGDWRLLNDINNDFNEESINIKPLKTNWRSERNIIDFNNRFFNIAAQLEADTIMPEDAAEQEALMESENLNKDIALQRACYARNLRTAYSDVAQEVPAKKGDNGLVRIEMLPTSSTEEFQEATLKRTLEYTLSLIQQGTKLSDIAIIVRSNSEATLIANHFAKNAPHLSIISEQAFALQASPVVVAIVSALKVISNKNDIESRITLLKIYCSLVKMMDYSDNELLTDDSSFCHYMPEDIADDSRHGILASMSLYELVEHLYQILELDKIKGQELYTCAFFDGLKAFIDEKGAVVEEFLAYWDSELYRKAISVSGLNSIVVITIHKSKGLEYKHVIMPFANWRIGPITTMPTTLWCKIDEEPFSALPFIPVNYTGRKALSASIYDKYGTEEWMQDIVDNLNLLYVAFTRAGSSLFIVTDQATSDNSRTKLIFNTILRLSTVLEGAKAEGLEELLEAEKRKKEKKKGKKSDNAEPAEQEKIPVIFTYGQLATDAKDPDNDEEEIEDNIFEVKPSGISVSVHSYNNKGVIFRQSNKSREFAKDNLEDSDTNRYTTMGSIMHMLFSQIKTTNDIDKVLRQFEFDGVIYDDDITPEELRCKLKEKFSNPVVADWFSDRWTIFNECNIMKLVNGKIKEERPDRVITDGEQTIVIDYKFGKRSKGYNSQVSSYINLLRDMGYKNVRGYLWYVNEEDGVEEVHSA